MLSGRICLLLGSATVALVALDGCWVSSSSSGSGLVGSAAGSTSSAGATSTVGGSTSASGGSAAAGAPSAGATSTVGGSTSAGGATTSTGGATTTTGGATSSGGATSAGGATGTGGAGSFPAGCPAPSTTAHQATALDRSCWVATASDCSLSTANENPPMLALDGMETTRFSTGLTMAAETSAFTFQVDMSSAVMITGVKVDSSVITDAALQLEVDVSTDGTTWSPVACGAAMTVTDISFTAVSARYVRVIQYGSSTGTGQASGWWSIHEFNVYGSLGTEKACATAGTGPTGSTCTTPHT